MIKLTFDKERPLKPKAWFLINLGRQVELISFVLINDNVFVLHCMTQSFLDNVVFIIDISNKKLENNNL